MVEQEQPTPERLWVVPQEASVTVKTIAGLSILALVAEGLRCVLAGTKALEH